MARAACGSLPFRHYIGGNRRKRLKLRCFREFRCEKTRIDAIFGISLASWGDVAGFDTNLTDGPCRTQGLVLLSCGVYGNMIRFLYPLTIPNALFERAMGIRDVVLKI